MQDRPAEAPQEGPWIKEVIVAANPGFVDALNAVNTVVLSYGGVSAYVSVAGEMKNPREYAKAMFASHTFMTAVYLVISCVCYHYVGQYIASPVSLRLFGRGRPPGTGQMARWLIPQRRSGPPAS